jgi:hypothetical protein
VVASKAKIMNRLVIPKRNVIRADILVAPLDVINEVIQTYHRGSLHNCTCIVLTDVKFNCPRKYMNHLQLMDCKCENDPKGNCDFEE